MFESVVINDFGTFLGKRSERLVVHRKGRVVREVPLFRVAEILLPARGAAISSDLIHDACQRGIRIGFQLRGGRPFAMLTSPMLTATVQTRRAQLEAYGDDRGARFARAVVMGKVKNQTALLRYVGKYLKEAAPDTFAIVDKAASLLEQARQETKEVVATRIEDIRQTLLGIEGSAGRVYWSAIRDVIGGKYAFEGREHRGALDAVNALLNYGYGILYARTWGAILGAGLDPFAGFMHADRSGKPSLVLDLVEEFRSAAVDRVVLAIVKTGQRVRMVGGRLDDETKALIATHVAARLNASEPYRGKKLALGSIIQAQARRLAVCLRDGEEYRTYSLKW